MSMKFYLQQINKQPKNSHCPVLIIMILQYTHTQTRVYEMQIIQGCEREVLSELAVTNVDRSVPTTEQITVWCQLLSQPTKSSSSPAVHIQNNSNSRL